MAQYMKYPFIVKKIVIKYLKENYKGKEKEILTKIYQIYDKFVEGAPDIGGKENNMSSNLYLALAVFAFYEAIDRKITKEEIEDLMIKSIPKRIPVITNILDLNKPSIQKRFKNRFVKYKEITDEKAKTGEWNNNWKVEINPHNREKGVAFDLIGCPLVDFAKSHGYMNIMPVLCKLDYLTARLMNAELIREHTIAEGSSYCDYWYVGNKK